MNANDAITTAALPQPSMSSTSQDPRREYQEALQTASRLSTQFRRHDPAWDFAITRYRNSLVATIAG